MRDALPDLQVPPGAALRAVVYDAARADQWAGWLSDEERCRIKRFGAERRVREFIAGRAAARRLLADRLNTSPMAVRLRVADDGAVEVPHTPWHLSIAHTGPNDAPRAVAVCAPYALAIDVEQIQPRSPDLRQFLFAPHDRALPDALPHNENTSLLLCWTLKEAVLKARRSGFRCSPKRIQLTIDAEARTATAQVEAQAWELRYTQWDNAWCAVAWSRPM